ncbi:MAG: hypothetical protein JSW32_03415, partial [Deltaproteobacteria bacterium]
SIAAGTLQIFTGVDVPQPHPLGKLPTQSGLSITLTPMSIKFILLSFQLLTEEEECNLSL